MEDTKCRRWRPLAVLCEFAGSRLEKQVLMRAYELTVPAARVRVVGVQRTSAGEHVTRIKGRSRAIMKGA